MKTRFSLKAYVKLRGAAFVATVIIILGQTWIANALGLRPVWLLPAISGVLLLISVVIYRDEYREPPRILLHFAHAVVWVLVIADLLSLIWLVLGIFFSHSQLSAGMLLVTGIALWIVNVMVFALAYWEFDKDGPEARDLGTDVYPDFVFPQQTDSSGTLAPKDWQPGFADYLYVSVTSATAFSPTDTMPYTKTAKLLMASESIISFFIFGMLVARAINIAAG
jgi:uncharacterized membrane protein